MGKKKRLDKFTYDTPDLIYKLCSIFGAMQYTLADFFDITYQSMSVWASKNPQIGEAIKEGKEYFHTHNDKGLFTNLYKSALMQKRETRTFLKGKGDSKLTLVRREETDLPGDANASMWLLKHLMPEVYGDKLRIYVYSDDMTKVGKEVKRVNLAIERALELPTISQEQEANILRSHTTNLVAAITISKGDKQKFSKDTGADLMFRIQNACVDTLDAILNHILTQEQSEEIDRFMKTL